MNGQSAQAIQATNFPSGNEHREAVDVDGLDHIFRWASDVVADGEDSRARLAREKRIRRQVLEVVQRAREERALSKSTEEIAYLQRRVIALLQKLQEVTEENALAKQIMVSQYYALGRVAELETEVKLLKSQEFEREAAITERRYLMDALARVKVDRDMLDAMLTANEQENIRLARMLKEARAEIGQLQERRWWHLFWPFPARA